MTPITHAAMSVHSAAVSAGIFDSANNLITQAISTVKAVVLFAAICVVLASLWSKSWRYTAVVTTLAVFVVWLVTFDGISYLASLANGDLSGAAVVPAVSQVLIG